MAIITYTSNKGNKYTIKDADEIHRGGEGRIMLLTGKPDFVAKLYHSGINTISEQQYNFLTKLDRTLFVVPEELLSDGKGKIAGFTMKYVGKDYFPLSSIFSKNFCTRNNISEALKIQISQKLITSVEYAHRSNIIIGDLNQYNVLVNNKGDVKLIDTDSYESPQHKHSGMLLDDIRDYLYGGKVCKNSDFFALSVLLFYNFTHTHPFKGIHKTYKKMSDRMIQKLPIFLKTPDIKVPKIYKEISDKKLMFRFEELYLQGKRFLMSLSGVAQISGIKKAVPITKITKKDLIITTIVENLNIIDIKFTLEKGLIETSENFIIFDTQNKGYVSKLFTVSKKDYDKIYISSNNILFQKNTDLFYYVSETQIVKLTNITVPETSFISVFEDILLIIDDNVMFSVYMNDIKNNFIRNKRTEVLGKSFTHFTGLTQNTGGIRRIFYNSGKDITNIKLDKSIKEIRQSENVGIVQYLENNSIKNRYFKISGMKSQISDTDLERVYDFAYMPSTKEDGFIFEPADDSIKIVRTQDFKLISTMECELITELSKLQYCKSGIVAWEGNSVYLLNKV